MTPTITEDATLTELRRFLLAVLPGSVEVIAGQVNRVPQPASANYVVFWPLLRARMSTNVDTWTRSADTLNVQRSTRFDVQANVYGPSAADNAQVITTLWRDDYAVSFINGAIMTPLYASDGHQAPFVDGEAQYENRWTLTLTMQVKPSIVLTSQFADTLAVTLIEADTL